MTKTVTVGGALYGPLHPPGSLPAQMLRLAGAVVGVQAIGPGTFCKQTPPARRPWPSVPAIPCGRGFEGDKFNNVKLDQLGFGGGKVGFTFCP